ncbi:MAG TPA: hypothetical protein VKT49_23135 [Bryobacteraceae bacterium]|nr:hypothetical protein [Bryobacteraceae bacterium]
MPKMSGPHLRNGAAILATVALSLTAGCASDPEPPDLTASDAGALISQKWSRDEMNHFPVTFHSDTLIGCGIENGLWKRVEATHQGFTFNSYQLTEAGRKALFAIDLKESGKFHEVTLLGPYRLEVAGVALGTEPDTRQVQIRWELDWDKAPAGVKACLPRFELSGSQVALFKLNGPEWRFLSFLKPAGVPPPPQAAIDLLIGVNRRASAA